MFKTRLVARGSEQQVVFNLNVAKLSTFRLYVAATTKLNLFRYVLFINWT